MITTLFGLVGLTLIVCSDWFPPFRLALMFVGTRPPPEVAARMVSGPNGAAWAGWVGNGLVNPPAPAEAGPARAARTDPDVSNARHHRRRMSEPPLTRRSRAGRPPVGRRTAEAIRPGGEPQSCRLRAPTRPFTGVAGSADLDPGRVQVELVQRPVGVVARAVRVVRPDRVEDPGVERQPGVVAVVAPVLGLVLVRGARADPDVRLPRHAAVLAHRGPELGVVVADPVGVAVRVVPGVHPGVVP